MKNETLSDVKGDWLRQSFMLPRSRFSQLKNLQKQYGDVRFKFTDTVLGGMFSLNPPPQSCQIADPRKSGPFYQSKEGKWKTAAGLGTAYSRMIDDNAERVTMRCGVAKYNSLTTWFTGFYNPHASYLARTGRVPDIFYKVGKVAGFVLALPLLPVIIGAEAFKWAAIKPASQFYYFQPAMPLFWNRLNFALNHLTPALKMSESAGSDSTREYLRSMGGGDDVPTLRNSDMSARLHAALPELFSEDGNINIYAVANRAGRLSEKFQTAFREIMEDADDSQPLYERMDKYFEENQHAYTDDAVSVYENAGAAATAYAKTKMGENDPKLDSDSNGRGRVKANEEGNVAARAIQTVSGWLAEAGEHYTAERRDGSAFITFDVDKVETVSESWSNTVRNSDMMEEMNSKSASAKNQRFNFAEGNLSDGGVLGMVEAVGRAVKDVAVGVMDGVQMSGLLALSGTAFVDIMKHWDNSEMSFDATRYTMKLRSIRHDKYSILTRLYIPMLAIVSAASASSTGAGSYTSPLLVQLFHVGKGQIRTGMISSVEVTRGTGDIGWTSEGLPLGIDISFTVVDNSNMMHMGLAEGIGLKQLSIFDEESKLNDYIAMLGALSVSDQVYIRRRFALATNRTRAQWKSWFSPARAANWLNGTLPGRVINTFSRELDRPI